MTISPTIFSIKLVAMVGVKLDKGACSQKAIFQTFKVALATHNNLNKNTIGLECRATAFAVVRHHRGSAAVAKCGAEIHDRGNLQLCERAFCVQWRCELLAMNGGKIDLGSLLTKVYLSDIRGRVSDPHRQPPTSTTATNKKDADCKKSASCAQNRTRTYTSLNTRT